MADTFKKSEDSPSSPSADAKEDAWKDVVIEKEHQPETPPKVKFSLNYRNMEKQVSNLDRDIANLTKQKKVVQEEMVKVKTIAEA